MHMMNFKNCSAKRKLSLTASQKNSPGVGNTGCLAMGDPNLGGETSQHQSI